VTTGLAGLMLHLWVIAGCALLATTLPISLTRRRLLSILSCFSPAARQRFIWSLVLLPWVLGVITAVLTLIPSIRHLMGLTLDHCYSHSNHHEHLCWFHPADFFWLSWMGFCASFLLALAFWKCLQILHRLWQQSEHLKMLLRFADQSPDGNYILDSNIPSAFTAGLLAPKILLSRALIAALNTQELTIVERHERIHQLRRDPLQLWLLNVVLSVFLPAARRDLYAALELSLEQMVDAEVAGREGPTSVAATLIKVNRLNLHYLKHQAAVGQCSFGTAAVEERVQQLLKIDKGRRFPWCTFLLSWIGLMVIAIYCADGFHHTIETLLHHHP
jgi:Zn-dependent protease with chaperone function